MRLATLKWIALLVLAVGALAIPVPSSAQEGPVDLLSQADGLIRGTNAVDTIGSTIANVGDVDDDGIRDLAIGDFRNDRAWVLFGDGLVGTRDLTTPITNGFVIEGVEASQFGQVVGRAGDVNNDGMSDIIIGAPFADNNGREDSGSAYVIFGKTTTTTVDVATMTTEGFRIDGAAAEDKWGIVVDSANFVNSDALADVVIGSGSADAAYVLFGKATTDSVDLDDPGTGGYFITGPPLELVGGTVAGVGDMNDDGEADVAVGALTAGHNSRPGAGAAYIVFGKTTDTTVELDSLGAGGFVIDGAAEGDQTGRISGVGDFNDDDVPDVLVGAALADNNGRDTSGSIFVVFGKASTSSIDLAALGDAGIRIDGAGEDDLLHDVGRALDVNDDGLSDVVVGANNADNNSREDSGSAYVIFGTAQPGDVDLAQLDPEVGFRLDGAAVGDSAGDAVAGMGDLNGDGFGDLAIGAPLAENGNTDRAGAVYIKFAVDWLPGACANTRTGTDEDDTLIGGAAGDDLFGSEGNDVLKGEAGADCAEGDLGADEIFGGSGGDDLKGNDGGDTIKGGDGTDEIDGGDGTDTAEGGAGVDDISGGAKQDTLRGGEKGDTLSAGDGSDTVTGGGGGDTLTGGEGADTVTGGAGKDTIEAGDGADVIEVDDGEKDTIECGGGNDTVDHDNKDILIGC